MEIRGLGRRIRGGVGGETLGTGDAGVERRTPIQI